MHICLLHLTATLQNVLTTYLTHQGHTVSNTLSVEDSQHTPDLIIAEDSSRFCTHTQFEKIHQKYPRTPILLISDRPMNISFAKSQQYSIQAFLRRVFSLSELDMAIWQATRA